MYERIPTEFMNSHIPVILNRGGKDVPLMQKEKFLVDKSLTVGHVLYIVRKRVDINSGQGLFLLTDDHTTLASGCPLMDTYQKYRAEDGFLYLKYRGENTFGGPAERGSDEKR